jgi:hypothetical protein
MATAAKFVVALLYKKIIRHKTPTDSKFDYKWAILIL